MAVPQPYDVIETGKDLLIDFWKNKPVMQGLLKSQLREIQKLEDLTFQLLNERNVNDAVGVQLNVIGSIVGEDRQGRLDVEYREAILNRIALNRSDGTPPVILDILNVLSGSPIPNIFEHYPASFHAYVDRGSSHNLAKTLEDVSAAGVQTRLLFDWEEDSLQFCEVETSFSPFTLEDASLFSTDDGTATPILTFTDHKYTATNNRTFLPEIGEDINYLCEVFDGTEYQLGFGSFDVGDNTLLQLEDGSLFEWQEIREI